jgi:hypothetical protein
MLVTTYVAIWANYDTLGNVFNRLEWIASMKSRVWYAGISGRFGLMARASRGPGIPPEPALADAGIESSQGMPNGIVRGDGTVVTTYSSRSGRFQGRARRKDASIITVAEEGYARGSTMQTRSDGKPRVAIIEASDEGHGRNGGDNRPALPTVEYLSASSAAGGASNNDSNNNINRDGNGEPDNEVAARSGSGVSVMLVSMGAFLVHKFGGHGFRVSKIGTGYGGGGGGGFRKIGTRVSTPLDETGATNEKGAGNEVGVRNAAILRTEAIARNTAFVRTEAIGTNAPVARNDAIARSEIRASDEGSAREHIMALPSARTKTASPHRGAFPTTADIVLSGIPSAGASTGSVGTMAGSGMPVVMGNFPLNGLGMASPLGTPEAISSPIGALTVSTVNIHSNVALPNMVTLSNVASPAAGAQPVVNSTAQVNGMPILYDVSGFTRTPSADPADVKNTGTHAGGTVAASANLKSLQSSPTDQSDPFSAVVDQAVTPTVANQAVTPTTQDRASLPVRPAVVAPRDTSIYSSLGSALSLSAQSTNAALLDRLGESPANGSNRSDSWIDVTGVQTKLDDTLGTPGFEVHQYGFMAGVDHRTGDFTVGISGGYSHADIGEQQTGDTGTTDTLRAALYGSRWLGPLEMSATLGYGLDFLSQKRPFEHAGTAEGDHMGQEITAAAQASMPIALAGMTITPRLGLRYAYFHGDGFQEHGANGQDLSVGTDNVHSLQPYAEATLDKTFGSELRPVSVQIRIGYAQELLDTNRVMTVGQQSGTSFAAPGATLPRGQLTTGLSVSVQASKATTILLSYDALINTGHASSQAADVRLDYRF